MCEGVQQAETLEIYLPSESLITSPSSSHCFPPLPTPPPAGPTQLSHISTQDFCFWLDIEVIELQPWDGWGRATTKTFGLPEDTCYPQGDMLVTVSWLWLPDEFLRVKTWMAEKALWYLKPEGSRINQTQQRRLRTVVFQLSTCWN